MVYIRKKYICKNQIKKGIGGTKEIIDLIKKKNSIALMVDQRLGESKDILFWETSSYNYSTSSTCLKV